jgi:hypothetical protein
MLRAALRLYLEAQAGVSGSRAHFTQNFQQRLDRVENTLSFQLTLLTYLLATGLALLIT